MKNKEILFFTARYCGKCYAIKKRIKQLESENLFNISYKFVDVEKDKATTKKYSVVGVPITLCLEDGIVVKTIKGSLYREDLLELVK